jgi:hypothetical protein
VPLHLGNFPITGYVVKIYLHGAADPFKVDNVGASTYEYTKSDLNVNQQYDFRVAATYGVDKKRCLLWTNHYDCWSLARCPNFGSRFS